MPVLEFYCLLKSIYFYNGKPLPLNSIFSLIRERLHLQPGVRANNRGDNVDDTTPGESRRNDMIQKNKVIT